VQVSGTIRSDQGDNLAANWANAVIQPSLGRPLSNSAPTATVNLIEPGTLYGDRVNELDLRFAKILRFGGTRTNVGGLVQHHEQRASSYLQPGLCAHRRLADADLGAPGRFFKISAQIAF
jgi:hypothetical protein